MVMTSLSAWRPATAGSDAPDRRARPAFWDLRSQRRSEAWGHGVADGYGRMIRTYRDNGWEGSAMRPVGSSDVTLAASPAPGPKAPLAFSRDGTRGAGFGSTLLLGEHHAVPFFSNDCAGTSGAGTSLLAPPAAPPQCPVEPPGRAGRCPATTGSYRPGLSSESCRPPTAQARQHEPHRTALGRGRRPAVQFASISAIHQRARRGADLQ